jgi:hypothetical protein
MVAAAADAFGNAIAAWLVDASWYSSSPCSVEANLRASSTLWVSRYTVGTGWSPAVQLWARYGDPELTYARHLLEAGMDSAGNATIVWTFSRGGGRFAILAARRSAEGVWGLVEELGEELGYRTMSYASAPSGHGMVAWGDENDLWSRRHDSTGWLPAELVAPGMGWWWSPLPSVNARGDAVIVQDFGNGTFRMHRRDARAGWWASDFTHPHPGTVVRVVLDDSGAVAHLGASDRYSSSRHRAAWVARYDEATATWSEPAFLFDLAGGIGGEVEGIPFFVCEEPTVDGLGLFADAGGNLTAWAQDVTVLSRSDVGAETDMTYGRVLVVARRYHAASATWGPVETVYSTDAGTHDFYLWTNSTQIGSGKKTGVLGAGGSCSTPALMGVVMEWGQDSYQGNVWWCEHSLHLTRLPLPRIE